MLNERQRLKEARAAVDAGGASVADRVRKILELAGSACSLYETGTPDEKRELVMTVTLYLSVTRENVGIMLADPFQMIAERNSFQPGAPTDQMFNRIEAEIIEFAEFFEEARSAPRNLTSEVQHFAHDMTQ